MPILLPKRDVEKISTSDDPISLLLMQSEQRGGHIAIQDNDFRFSMALLEQHQLLHSSVKDMNNGITTASTPWAICLEPLDHCIKTTIVSDNFIQLFLIKTFHMLDNDFSCRLTLEFV